MSRQIFRRSAPDWFGPIRVGGESAEQFGGPRRRVRGRRRYYRALRRQTERFVPVLSAWHDLAHWHVDSRGYGNESWRARRAHLEALFAIFRSVLAEAGRRGG